MNQSSNINWARIAVWAVAGFVAVKYVIPLFQSAGKVRDSIANPLGDALARLLVDKTPVDVRSGVVFPSGEKIAMNKLLGGGIYLDEDRRFTIAGKRYELISPRRSDGWFNARLVS